jgi:peptidyl-prolyl cis-trans isomerase C
MRRLAATLCLALLPAMAAAQTTTQPAAPASPPAGAASSAPAPGGDPVVARVNGKELHRSDVIESARSLPEPYQQQIDQLFPALIERLIDLNLLAAEGRREGLQNDPAVKAQVAQFEDQAVREAVLDRYLKSKVTDDAIKARYEKFLKETPPQTEVRARHILVDSEDKANAIIKELDGGANFAELASKDSLDKKAAANGGDLGYFTASDMVPEFAEAAFALDKGQYTKKPVKTRFGWHIILVEDKREKKPPTLDEARSQIESELTQELVGAYLADLRGKAQIEKFNPDGSPIKPAPATPPASGNGAAGGEATTTPPAAGGQATPPANQPKTQP